MTPRLDYIHTAKRIDTIAIPLADDLMSLDALLSAVDRIRKIADDLGIDPLSVEQATMQVGSENYGNDYLVITLKSNRYV